MAENWTVTNQQQQMMQTSGGQWVDSMRVTFTTAGGVVGYVQVPMSLYSAAEVKKLIEARVTALDSVAQL